MKINVLLIIALFVICIISISFGTEFINVFNMNDEIDYILIYELRIPRTICAIVSGATLGLSGLIMQKTLNNSLADSSILGFQSGASLMGLIVLMIFPVLSPVLSIFCFMGGMISFIVIYLINKNSMNKMKLILSGISLNAIIGSLISVITILYSERIQSGLSFLNGSLNATNKDDAYLMLVISLVIITFVMLELKTFDLLELDDINIKLLNINPKTFRLKYCIYAILLCSISVSFVGMIGFVGLISPHLARLLSSDNKYMLSTTTCLIGAILVLGSDTMQRIIFKYYEIPVGVIMSIAGGIFFIYLLSKETNVNG